MGTLFACLELREIGVRWKTRYRGAYTEMLRESALPRVCGLLGGEYLYMYVFFNPLFVLLLDLFILYRGWTVS